MSAVNAEPEKAQFYDAATSTPTNNHHDDATANGGPLPEKQSEKDTEQQSHTPSQDSISEEDVQDGAEKPVGRPDLNRTQSQADQLGTVKITIIMFSLCMALFLAALDVTIISTALPTIAGVFKASSADYTWIGSSYLLACASSVPLWGKISDIWGRKPVILVANVIFMIGSLISALANSIGMLIGGRVIQGIGGGGLVILCNICVSDLFSMRERAKYFGVLGGVWAIASGIGPVLGGVFTEKVSWRWCFYINLPLDGLAFVMLVFFLKLETPKTPIIAGLKSIDWVGVLLIVGGVVMFLFGMESGGQTQPWGSAYTICLIVFGIFTIFLFFINEWKFAKYPIMPLRLFKESSNMAALGVCFCHGFVFIGGTYYLPLYFQTVLEATPILSGVYLFPLVLSLSAGAIGVGIFIKKVGKYRPPIWFGLVFMTLGFGLFIDFDDHANWPKIIIFQFIAGIGVGPNFQVRNLRVIYLKTPTNQLTSPPSSPSNPT
jgi:EmrB/QacA subfamily drug resistance transporter